MVFPLFEFRGLQKCVCVCAGGGGGEGGPDPQDPGPWRRPLLTCMYTKVMGLIHYYLSLQVLQKTVPLSIHVTWR